MADINIICKFMYMSGIDKVRVRYGFGHANAVIVQSQVLACITL